MDDKPTTAEIVNEILKGLVTASMVGSIIVAPGLAQAGDLALRYLDKRAKKLKDAKVMYYMKRKHLVDYRQLPDGSYELNITKQGKQRELLAKIENLKISKPAKWDERWRLVMFDIPETHRKSRGNLSQKLRQMDFYQLQKSVWVYPYPCQKEVQLIKEAFEIPDGCVILADIERIDNETRLRKQFAL